MKVNRSSSKRAYKKRRTVRKSRVNRRRKTQRGGGWPDLGSLAKAAAEKAAAAATSGIAKAAAFKIAFQAQPALEAINKLSTSLFTLVFIAKNFASNPIAAKQLLDEKIDILKAANPNATECIDTIRAKINVAANAAVAKAAGAAAAVAAAAGATEAANFDKLQTPLDNIRDNLSLFMAMDNVKKAEFLKGIVLAKKVELDTAISVMKTANPDIFKCFNDLKTNIETKVNEHVLVIQTKFDEIKTKYSTEIEQIKTVLNAAKTVGDRLKALGVAARARLLEEAKKATAAAPVPGVVVARPPNCPVCPVCKS